jgi:hypothetical protein
MMIQMFQLKQAFPIEIESVRRMFRAKPSMNAIVVQLLVDLSGVQIWLKKKCDGEQKLFSQSNHESYVARKMNFFQRRRWPKALNVAGDSCRSVHQTA